MDKKILYTAIKPTGRMTLGNYIGAVMNLKKYTQEYCSIICVADLHALTINLDPKELKDNSYAIIAFYLACGLDPDKIILYAQSHVKEHAELGWVLSNFTMFGEANRMTQFKDYVAKGEKIINCGLFNYPILMAADILLYDTNVVPVGIDQKQHVELARNIAIRFNHKIGDTFVIPEPLVDKTGAKIGGLNEPTKKMSKSTRGDTGTIFLEDSDDVIRKKIRKAVTDSEGVVKYDMEHKPGVSNLLLIYSKMKNITIAEAEEHFKDANYGTLKNEVADSVIEVIAPIREKFNTLLADKDYLDTILEKGAQKAEAIAKKKLKEVYDKIGLMPRKSLQ